MSANVRLTKAGSGSCGNFEPRGRSEDADEPDTQRHAVVRMRTALLKFEAAGESSAGVSKRTDFENAAGQAAARGPPARTSIDPGKRFAFEPGKRFSIDAGRSSRLSNSVASKHSRYRRSSSKDSVSVGAQGGRRFVEAVSDMVDDALISPSAQTHLASMLGLDAGDYQTAPPVAWRGHNSSGARSRVTTDSMANRRSGVSLIDPRSSRDRSSTQSTTLDAEGSSERYDMPRRARSAGKAGPGEMWVPVVPACAPALQADVAAPLPPPPKRRWQGLFCCGLPARAEQRDAQQAGAAPEASAPPPPPPPPVATKTVLHMPLDCIKEDDISLRQLVGRESLISSLDKSCSGASALDNALEGALVAGLSFPTSTSAGEHASQNDGVTPGATHASCVLPAIAEDRHSAAVEDLLPSQSHSSTDSELIKPPGPWPLSMDGNCIPGEAAEAPPSWPELVDLVMRDAGDGAAQATVDEVELKKVALVRSLADAITGPEHAERALATDAYALGCQSESSGPQLPDRPLTQHEIKELGFAHIMGVAEHWDAINPFVLNRLFGEHTLALAALALISSRPRLRQLRINYERLTRFLLWVEQFYTAAPYHNTMHALHVLLATHCLLESTNLTSAIGYLELLCCYVVAICHDVGHHGTNSIFLVKTRADIAAIFGMDSPLERGHVAIFSLLMQMRSNNFLPCLSDADHGQLNEMMMALTKATDMKAHLAVCSDFCQHSEQMCELADLCAGVASTPADEHSVPLWGPAVSCDLESDTVWRALMLVLKCADLSHVAATLSVHRAWVARLEEEFWRQGDLEVQLDITPVDLFDRNQPERGVHTTQVGFFKVVALPMYEAFVQAFPACSFVLDLFHRNMAHWEAEATEQLAQQSHRSCELPAAPTAATNGVHDAQRSAGNAASREHVENVANDDSADGEASGAGLLEALGAAAASAAARAVLQAQLSAN